jgi:hypothetical protein
VFPDSTVQDPNEHVQAWRRELVFNGDAVDISDWEDYKTRKAVVPRATRGQTIHQRRYRNVKHLSVIVCVFVARESHIPISLRPKKHGVRFGMDFVLKSNKNPYLDAEMFLDDIWTAF